MSGTYYGQAMTVACPKCGADVDHPCVSRGGQTLAQPHKARRDVVSETMHPLAAEMYDHAAQLRAQITTLAAQADALEDAAAILSS